MGNKENGLKLIRIQCNMSQTYLGDILGVTRQCISDWEKGKKRIIDERKKELSVIFGVSEEYFGEITEAQKEELLKLPMYHHEIKDKEFYLFKKESNDSSVVFFEERANTFDEELTACKKEIRKVVIDIENIFNEADIHERTRLYSDTLLIMKAFMSIIQ